MSEPWPRADGPAPRGKTEGLLSEAFLRRYRGDPRYFGDPDGARSDLSAYVDIRRVWGSPSINEPGQRVRVVIGPKGSGKTLYLRLLARNLERNPSLASGSSDIVVTESSPTQLLDTEQVIKIGLLFREQVLTEVWQRLWGRSIIAAATTQLIFHRNYRNSLSEDVRQDLQHTFRPLIGKVAAARTPLTCARAIVSRFSSRVGLTRHLNDPLWDDLATTVGELLKDSPPLVLVIDCVDDQSAHAPAYWARCQRGLFYETMRLLRSPNLGGRLLVMIAIRDVVYHQVFRSEHSARYVGDPHVRLLDWDYDSARELLDAKTRQIAPSLLDPPPQSFADWLGFEMITNSYGLAEPVYDYALRHCQMLPRDIVVLGNLIGEKMELARQERRPMDQDGFRRVVSDLALLSGRVQIGVAANQVVADEIPAVAATHDFIESYTAVDEYREDRMGQIIAIIKACGTLRFGPHEFAALQRAGREAFEAPDLASVLWQCGILGYQPPGDVSPVFFSLDREGRMRIPPDQAEYVFHSTMCEAAGLGFFRPSCWIPHGSRPLTQPLTDMAD